VVAGAWPEACEMPGKSIGVVYKMQEDALRPGSAPDSAGELAALPQTV